MDKLQRLIEEIHTIEDVGKVIVTDRGIEGTSIQIYLRNGADGSKIRDAILKTYPHASVLDSNDPRILSYILR